MQSLDAAMITRNYDTECCFRTNKKEALPKQSLYLLTHP